MKKSVLKFNMMDWQCTKLNMMDWQCFYSSKSYSGNHTGMLGVENKQLAETKLQDFTDLTLMHQLNLLIELRYYLLVRERQQMCSMNSYIGMVLNHLKTVDRKKNLPDP